jgi:hypothetical protein
VRFGRSLYCHFTSGPCYFRHDTSSRSERLAKKKAAEQLKAANAKEREKVRHFTCQSLYNVSLLHSLSRDGLTRVAHSQKAKARKLALAVAAKEKAVAKKLKEKAEVRFYSHLQPLTASSHVTSDTFFVFCFCFCSM